jgi:hypothetical protein
MNPQCPSRKYYFVVVQLAIEIYSLPVSTANGIKFSFIKEFTFSWQWSSSREAMHRFRTSNNAKSNPEIKGRNSIF